MSGTSAVVFAVIPPVARMIERYATPLLELVDGVESHSARANEHLAMTGFQ